MMSQETAQVRTLATAYIGAVGRGDFATLATLWHPDFEFRTGGACLGREASMGALRRLAPIVVRNEIQKIFVEGNQACVIYDFVTDTPTGAVRSIEWLVVEGGLIRSTELVFERQGWPAVLEELGRRQAAAPVPA